MRTAAVTLGLLLAGAVPALSQQTTPEGETLYYTEEDIREQTANYTNETPVPGTMRVSRWYNAGALGTAFQGGVLDVGALDAKAIKVEFSGVSCPACWRYMAAMQIVHEEYDSEGLLHIAIFPYDSDLETLEQRLDDVRITYPVLVDTPPEPESRCRGALFSEYARFCDVSPTFRSWALQDGGAELLVRSYMAEKFHFYESRAGENRSTEHFRTSMDEFFQSAEWSAGHMYGVHAMEKHIVFAGYPLPVFPIVIP